MHELSLMQGVMDAVVPAAKENGALKIINITLRIGEMTQVVEEAMRFAFDALTDGEELFDGCELTLDFVQAKSACFDCGAEFEHDRFHLKCPECGGRHTVVIAGKEMDIAGIEIETEDDLEQQS